MPLNRPLRRAEAATYLYQTHGIRRDDLDAWADSILSPPVRSTSELRQYRAERAGQ